MNFRPLLQLALVMLALSAVPANAEDSVRPEVGKPLQAVQELMRIGKYKEAAAKLRDLDAIPNKTPYEAFITDRMRGAVLASAGDPEGAAKALESVIAANRLPAAEQLRTHEALVGIYYRAKEYPKAATAGQRYLKEGGGSPPVRMAIIQAQYLTDDFSGAAKALHSNIDDDEKTGRAPSEDQLQLLANCYARLNDNAGYLAALEKLLARYPKKSYWPDVLARVQRSPGFSDRYALDVYRLKLAAGAMKDTVDFVDMAQLALQSGEPAEAKGILDQGFAMGALGSGADSARHVRLRDVAVKQMAADVQALGDNERQAKTPDAQARLGYTYVMNRQVDKGIALLERARDSGGFKYPDEAALHLAQAYRIAGKKDKALQTFRSINGHDGAAELARLWAILMESNQASN